MTNEGDWWGGKALWLDRERLANSLHGSWMNKVVVSGRVIIQLMYQYAAFPPTSSCSRRDKPVANAASISIEIYGSFTK